MSKTCLKYNCPNRITIGKETDDDVVNIICPKCERLLYVSDKREKKIKNILKRTFIFFFVIVLFSIGFYYQKSIKSLIISNKTPDVSIKEFFKHLNNTEYHEAFSLTENNAWYPYQTFKKKLSIWNNIELKSIHGKSYYSKYKADTILNVRYLTIIRDTIKELDFDFHMKKYDDKWKIIRLYFPRDPKIDALKINEVPKSAEDAIGLYFDFLNRGLSKKAYLLTTFKKEEVFINKSNCIEYVTILGKDKVIGKDEYNVNIKYKNNCKGRIYRNQLQKIEMRKTDYWRISNYEKMEMN